MLTTEPKKSSYSAQGNCVRAWRDETQVYVDDSKNPGPRLAIEPGAWRAFMADIKAGAP